MTNTDDIVAHFRRPCVCGPITSGRERHPNEACPFNHITDLEYAWFTVRRTGKPRNEGGGGVSWYCSCQDGNEDAPTCVHVSTLMGDGTQITTTPDATSERAAFAAGFGDVVVILSAYGESILRPLWAQAALAESEQRARASGGATGPIGPTGVAGPIGMTGIQGPVALFGASGAGPSFRMPVPSLAAAPPPADPEDEEEDADEDEGEEL